MMVKPKLLYKNKGFPLEKFIDTNLDYMTIKKKERIFPIESFKKTTIKGIFDPLEESE